MNIEHHLASARALQRFLSSSCTGAKVRTAGIPIEVIQETRMPLPDCISRILVAVIALGHGDAVAWPKRA